MNRPIAALARTLLALVVLACVPGLASAAPDVEGDVGVGLVRADRHLRGARDTTDVVPYLNAEAGRFFARIDTFGVRTVPLGAGHLELLGQWRGDGASGDRLERRRDSVPLGIGTLQVTPYGAFLATALHDFGRSRGDLVQALVAAEFRLGRTTFTPQVGAEWQSRRYVAYYDAPRASEAPGPYAASSAVNPFVGLLAESRIAGPWVLATLVRYTRAGGAIARSPLVEGRGQRSALVAVACRY